MAEETTLHNPQTGHTVTTSHPETISNLRYGGGYLVITPPDTPAKPAEARTAPPERPQEPLKPDARGEDTQESADTAPKPADRRRR